MMLYVRNIVKGITTLFQYLTILESDPTKLLPPRCPLCGYCTLKHHGRYLRKPDRNSTAKDSLNPVPILRFICGGCHHTCSTLPECMAPRRWYLWSLQESILKCLLKKNLFAQCILSFRLVVVQLPDGITGYW